jgi:hypothetical protein
VTALVMFSIKHLSSKCDVINYTKLQQTHICCIFVCNERF